MDDGQRGVDRNERAALPSPKFSPLYLDPNATVAGGVSLIGEAAGHGAQIVAFPSLPIAMPGSFS
jgi:hypothetical protein